MLLPSSCTCSSSHLNDKCHLAPDEISCQGNVSETPIFIGHVKSKRAKPVYSFSSSLLTFATLETSYYGNNWTSQVLHFLQLPFQFILSTFFHLYSFLLHYPSSIRSSFLPQKSPAPFKSLLVAVVLFIFFISSSSAFENNLVDSTSSFNPSSSSPSSSSSSSSSSITHKSDSGATGVKKEETSVEHPHPLMNSSPAFHLEYLNTVHSFFYSTVESLLKSFATSNNSSTNTLDDSAISSFNLSINTNEDVGGESNIAHSTNQVKGTNEIDSNNKNNLVKRSTLPRAHDDSLFESNNLLFNPGHQHQHLDEISPSSPSSPSSSSSTSSSYSYLKDESQLMQSNPPDSQDFVEKITLGAIFPTTALITIKRSYYKKISDAVTSLISGRMNFSFPTKYLLAQAQVVLMPLSPSPNEILENVCNQLLVKNVTAVIYMTNSEIYSSNAASAQYLMQLINYYGIPMIAWNADNVGLEQVSIFAWVFHAKGPAQNNLMTAEVHFHFNSLAFLCFCVSIWI